MLEGLCGSKSVQKILIYLFVNSRCYGAELQRSLKTSLTPLQKALARLEKGGIINSEYEGKTRIYELNPAYPLIGELEALIKKAYTLLPAHKKQEYYAAKKGAALNNEEQQLLILYAFWEKLGEVKQLAFKAKTKETAGWKREGKGEVVITKEGKNVMLFHERGVWKNKEGDEVSFSNVFRWTLDRKSRVIALEHLRRGMDHPVFLFYLAPSDARTLTSQDSHLCGSDAYFGQIHLDQKTLRLNWRVIGPKKNEEMDYYYY